MPLEYSIVDLRPIKRLEDAIRVFAIVRQQITNAHLVIVGEDSEREVGRGLQPTLQRLAESPKGNDPDYL